MKLSNNIKWYINQALDYLVLLYAKIKIIQYAWEKIVNIYYDDYYMKFKLFINLDKLRDYDISINRKNVGLTSYPDILVTFYEKSERKRKIIEKKYVVKFFSTAVLSKKTSMKTLKEDIIDFLYMLKELE